MRIDEIAKMIEADFPPSLAFEGDNAGLLIGDGEKEVKKILLTCDVDEGVVSEAAECGAELIVSHHPLMFFKTNRLTQADPEQRTIRLMIEKGIALYSAHTNLDAAAGGLNDFMAELLGMGKTEVVDVVKKDESAVHGYGRAAKLDSPITLGELMDRVIGVFGADSVRYTGETDRVVKKLAVNTGGGAGILNDAISLGCDVLITGDVKYNGFRDALERGMCIIDLMHYDSEHIVMDFFERYFKGRLSNVELVKSRKNVNVVKTYTV